MTDTDEPQELIEEVRVDEVPTRVKKGMTEKQLAALAAAREKAWAKRKEMGDISAKEKELEKKMRLLALRKRKKKVEQRLAKLEAGEDSSCTSSSEEEEVPIKSSTKRGKPRKPPADDDDMDEPRPLRVAPTRPPPLIEVTGSAEQLATMSREMLREKIQRESQAAAFASLFPGRANPFL